MVRSVRGRALLLIVLMLITAALVT
ncbi:MAG: hypothetical protein JWO33_1714, partial [Caulobacteraceae bacterium]|nr:hypothetical protein [Caulobacteraceae bacterium]